MKNDNQLKKEGSLFGCDVYSSTDVPRGYIYMFSLNDKYIKLTKTAKPTVQGKNIIRRKAYGLKVKI